ncbi:hypothetical protein G6F59_013106 [Rhizopus arrhizus]|nr:hypothetical protein G6F59_013106 [Rhizopus arrhizus]
MLPASNNPAGSTAMTVPQNTRSQRGPSSSGAPPRCHEENETDEHRHRDHCLAPRGAVQLRVQHGGWIIHRQLRQLLLAVVQHLVQRAVAEDRQPRQGETERYQQHAEHEFADGAATRDARDEQADERRPADPPGPVEHRPATQPFRATAIGVHVEALADHAAQVVTQVLHQGAEQVLRGAGAQHEQHQRDRHDRAGHFTHGLVGRRGGRQAFFDVALDVLHHHDRIVDHDADRQHQAEQAQRVDREAQQVQRSEGTDHRHRHRDQREERGTPGLQEQDHHQHHQRNGFQQRVHHGFDTGPHELRGVVFDAVFHARREVLLQFGHRGAHLARDVQRVGARRQLDRQARGGLAVVEAVDGVGLTAEFDARDIAQAHLRTVGIDLQKDAAEVFSLLQARRPDDGGIQLLPAHGRQAAQLAGRHLHVL